MAKFQTRLAELLSAQTGNLPSYASISWRQLAKETGVTGPTLKAWSDAAVGSNSYLERIEAGVLDKLMDYFDVSMSELIVTVPDPRLAQRLGVN